VNNTKNPPALFFTRMAQASKERPGTLVSLMTNFFMANYGKQSLPKTAADFCLYDQQAVAALTSVNFFDGQFTTVRTNFPGSSFVIPESEHTIVTAIRVCEGVNAAVQSTVWHPGAQSAAVKNALFNFSINGQKVLTNLPGTVFDSNLDSVTNAGQTDENVGFFFLYEPLVILGQTQLVTNVAFAAGSLPIANTNLRIELHGVRFIGN
jgi:hypothetical protein